MRKAELIVLVVVLAAGLVFLKTNFGSDRDLKPAPPTAECVPMGAVLSSLPGEPPGSGKFKQPCCAGLTSVGHPLDAMNGAAPGRVICAPCGDGTCDTVYENNWNCPSDCR